MDEALEGIYDHAPSLPGLVLVARQMNKSRGAEDNLSNTMQTMMAMLALLCKVDLDVLADKHDEHAEFVLGSITSEDSDEEDDDTVEDRPSGYLSRSERLTNEELRKVNELEIQLRTALNNMRTLLEQVKATREDIRTECSTLLDEFKEQNGNADFPVERLQQIMEETAAHPFGFGLASSWPAPTNNFAQLFGPIVDQPALQEETKEEEAQTENVRQITIG